GWLASFLPPQRSSNRCYLPKNGGTLVNTKNWGPGLTDEPKQGRCTLGGQGMNSVNPWTVGNRILGLDLKLRRMWVGGQRLHHGLTGVAVTTAGLGQLLARRTTANRAVALALLGGVLMAHDWKDRAVWFERGTQSD